MTQSITLYRAKARAWSQQRDEEIHMDRVDVDQDSATDGIVEALSDHPAVDPETAHVIGVEEIRIDRAEIPTILPEHASLELNQWLSDVIASGDVIERNVIPGSEIGTNTGGDT